MHLSDKMIIIYFLLVLGIKYLEIYNCEISFQQFFFDIFIKYMHTHIYILRILYIKFFEITSTFIKNIFFNQNNNI